MGGEERGGGGNRKETEARDMRSKARAWWSPTPRPAGQGLGRHFPPAILVAWGGIRGISDVKRLQTGVSVGGRGDGCHWLSLLASSPPLLGHPNPWIWHRYFLAGEL